LSSQQEIGLIDDRGQLETRLREVLADAATNPSLWVTAARLVLDRRFAEAAEIYAAMPFRPAEAEARVRAADQLISEGRRAEAELELERALAFWRSVGATRYLRQAQSLLARPA